MPDDMISGEHSHDPIGVVMVDMDGRKADCGCGIFCNRLYDVVLFPDLRHLKSYLFRIVLVRNDVDAICRHERAYPCNRLLDQRLPAVDPEQLLWHGLPAQRPEACAAPPCHNDGVQVIHCLGSL